MSWDTYFKEVSKYFRKYSKSSNSQFASNEVVQTIRGFSYNIFMAFGTLERFGKTGHKYL